MIYPTLVSNRFASASLPYITPSTVYAPGNVALLADSYGDRVMLCLTGGTSNAGSIASMSTDGHRLYVADDTNFPTNYTSGSTVWRDVTGRQDLGWDYACADLRSLVYPRLVFSTTVYAGFCLLDNESARVWVDCYAEFDTEVADTLCVNYRRNKISPNPWSNAEIHRELSRFVDIVSVDPDSPTHQRKAGASFISHNTSHNRGTIYWNGRVNYYGVSISLKGYYLFMQGPEVTKSAGEATSILMEDGTLHLDDVWLDTHTAYLSLVDSVLSLEGSSSLHVTSLLSVCGGSIEINQTKAPFLLGVGGVVRFIGVHINHTGLVVAGRLFYLRGVGVNSDITLSDCTGLRRSMFPEIPEHTAGQYDIRIEGGEMEGVYDAYMYERYTTHFTLSKVYDVFAVGGARDPMGRAHSYRVKSISSLKAKTKFALVDAVSVPVTQGYYEVELVILVPESYVLDPDDLWVDYSFPSSTAAVYEASESDPEIHISWIELELPPPADPPIEDSTAATLATAIGFYEDDTPTRLWSNKTNALNTTTSVATQIPTSTAVCEWLVLDNFGFAIPPTATITGIEVVLYRYRSGGSTGNVLDSQVNLYTDYHGWGNDKAKTGTNWPTTTSSSSIYGGSTDTWGFSELLGEHVNDPTFSLRILLRGSSSTSNRVANIRYATVRVWYSSLADEVPGRDPEIFHATSVTIDGNGYTVPGGAGATAIGGATPDDDTYVSIRSNISSTTYLYVAFPITNVYRQSGTVKYRIRARKSSNIGRPRAVENTYTYMTGGNRNFLSAEWTTYEYEEEFVGIHVVDSGADVAIPLFQPVTNHTGLGLGKGGFTLASSIDTGLGDSAVDYIAPPGYKAVSFKSIGYVGDLGDVTASVYLAYPNCDIYIDPFIRAVRLV